MLERIKQRAIFMRPVLVPIILYIGSMAVLVDWIEAAAGSLWQYALILIPFALGIWVVWSFTRAFSKLDELEHEMLMNGVGFSFALTLIFVETWGMLQAFAGFPPINGINLGLLMIVLWLVGKLWNKNQYKIEEE